MRDGFVYYYLMMLARRLPMLLLVFGGWIFAGIRWKRHPRVSLMTVVALAVYLFDAMIFSALLYWLPRLTENLGWTSGTVSWFYSAVFFCEDIVYAAVILLLVAAALTSRREPAASSP